MLIFLEVLNKSQIVEFKIVIWSYQNLCNVHSEKYR